MKILITGGVGYLGGRLVKYLLENTKHDVHIASRGQSKLPEWAAGLKIVKIDWNDKDSLLEICNGVDVVIHLAGMNAQDCSIDPVSALEVNGLFTARLLRAAVTKKVKRFIYMSTAHVYSSPLIGVINEESCPLNLHSYATSHRAGEDVVLAAQLKKEIEGIVIRLSNSFGAPADASVNCWMLLVNDLCRQALKNNTMTLHSSGIQKRDFITLTDTIKAVNHLIELPLDSLGNGVFNVGGRWPISVLEMTELLSERVFLKTGKKPVIHRNKNFIDEKETSLDFEMTKLINTGFVPSSHKQVNQELDELISFCIKEFSEH